MPVFRELGEGRLPEDVNLAVTEVQGCFRCFKEAGSLVLGQTDPVLGDENACGFGEHGRLGEEIVDPVALDSASPD
jgi:hypothetical protein